MRNCREKRARERTNKTAAVSCSAQRRRKKPRSRALLGAYGLGEAVVGFGSGGWGGTAPPTSDKDLGWLTGPNPALEEQALSGALANPCWVAPACASVGYLEARARPNAKELSAPARGGSELAGPDNRRGPCVTGQGPLAGSPANGPGLPLPGHTGPSVPAGGAPNTSEAPAGRARRFRPSRPARSAVVGDGRRFRLRQIFVACFIETVVIR